MIKFPAKGGDKMADSFFPSSMIDALAMLWMQNQDLSSKTPEEIYRMFVDAKEKIRNERLGRNQ